MMRTAGASPCDAGERCNGQPRRAHRSLSRLHDSPPEQTAVRSVPRLQEDRTTRLALGGRGRRLLCRRCGLRRSGTTTAEWQPARQRQLAIDGQAAVLELDVADQLAVLALE